MKKQWKLTYEILYTSEKEPNRYTVEFLYYETLLEFLRMTERHQNLISFTVEKIWGSIMFIFLIKLIFTTFILLIWLTLMYLLDNIKVKWYNVISKAGDNNVIK